jgi:integrase
VFCLRVLWRDASGIQRDSLHSLRTKDADIARVLALQFNEALERKRMMANKTKLPGLTDLVKPKTANVKSSGLPDISRKYELDLARGVMRADNLADHELMMQAIEAYKALHGALPPLQVAMAMGQPQQRPLARAPEKSLLFSQVVAKYLEEKKLDNSENTITAKRRTYDDFIEFLGDLEINLFGKPELVQWKTADLKRGIKAVRLNARLGQLHDLFNWAINNGYYTAAPTSPVEGLRIGRNSKLSTKYESYEPFSNDELKAIFGAGYLKKFHKPDFYWLPIVALFTGARREEIAALKSADVKMVDDVQCIHIQKGKTADARRLVPVHPKLVELGFINYAKHLQETGEEFLFPHLTEGANGKGKNAGRQFSDWLDEVGITDKRKVFHSFRHTAITRLHATGANPAHVMQITGHSSETQGVHFHTYTHDVGLKALSDTLKKLVYPLEFEPISVPDPTFKEFLANWKQQQAKRAKYLERIRKQKINPR